MKSYITILLFFVSIGASAQNKDCSKLWLADPFDSINMIKQTTEKFLETELVPVGDGESKMTYEMKDRQELSHVNIWMKQKRIITGGNTSVIYVINSFKISGLTEKLEGLFNSLKQKVSGCTSQSTATSIIFSGGKIMLENQGGDYSKKNIPISTLTVASK